MNKNRISTVIFIFCFLLMQSHLTMADEIKDFISHDESFSSWSISAPEYVINYNFNEAYTDYQETQFRRFETIFFISLPASFLFSFLGIVVYRGLTGATEAFSRLEYQYLFLSSIGISVSIALIDNRTVYRRTTKTNGESL